MGKVFLIVSVSFGILLLVNLVFVILNVVFWATHGLQALLQGMNFVQRIYYSIYLKWILLADGIWLISALIYALKRKHYKTESELHYLVIRPIVHPKICVVMPAYNEELIVKQIIYDFKNQKNVQTVIVIDNHSSDKTVEIARSCGAQVITKESNEGYAHSAYVGLKEALKTDSDIIFLVDTDGTFSGCDMEKMVPYLNNCDMVVGTRLVQVLNEKGNQLSMFYVWGNYFLAKLLQIKYFSLLHMGIVQLTDVGCSFRCIRREALEKIIDKFTYPGTDKVVVGNEFALFMTMIGIENNLRVVEVPVTFKKRIGVSKTGSDKKKMGIIYGLKFLWYIVSS